MTTLKKLFQPKNTSWYLWDFGTELLLVNASIYFSEWLVVDNKVPDFWYSLAFIVSTIVLIFVSPYLGVVLDRRGNRKKVFFYLTLLTLISGVLIQAFSKLPSFGARIGLTLASYALLNFFFQLGGFVYNTFLKDISNKENSAKVAGLGLGFSTIGDAAGLLISLPIILGMITIFGTSRVSMLFPMAVLAAIFCLPMYFAFRGHGDKPLESAKSSKYKQIWKDIKDTKSYPGVTRLLIAFSFYNDAILTMQLFAAIYLDKVYHLPDKGKVIIIMLVYLSYTIGAWAGGYVGDKVGNKRSLIFGTISTAVVVALIAFGSSPGPFMYILFALFGISAGTVFANTKALFSKLIPYEKKAQFFGIYSIFERFASVVGPAAWGAVVYLASSKGAMNYRLAVLAMSFFILLGAFIARKVKEA